MEKRCPDRPELSRRQYLIAQAGLAASVAVLGAGGLRPVVAHARSAPFTASQSAGSAVGGPTAPEIEAEVLAVRDAPLRHLDVRSRVSVIDHGAFPDTGVDATPGIEAAIARARQELAAGNGPVEVYFPTGTYTLDPPGTMRGQVLDLTEMHDIVLNGNDSQVVIRNPSKGFLVVNDCENVIVQDFKIDYDPLPFTQGVVTNVRTDLGYAEVTLDDGFPSLNMDHFHDTNPERIWAIVKDRVVPGRNKFGVRQHYFLDDWVEIEDGVFRVSLETAAQLADFEVGDRYVQVARQNGSSLTQTNRSRQVTFLRVTNYASPTANYISVDTDLLNILECQVLLKAPRWHSINGGGVTPIHSNLRGPWVEGCVFEGLGDDGLNVHGRPLTIEQQVSDTELVFSDAVGGFVYRVEPGHTLHFFDSRNGTVLAEAMVIEIEDNRVSVDPALPQLPLADVLVYNYDVSSDYFVIRNNVFRNQRRFAHLISSHHGIIADNVYEGFSNRVMQIKNTPSGAMLGLVVDHLVIRDNTFRECFDVAAIAVEFVGNGQDRPTDRPHGDIHIVDNRFADWSQHAITISNAERVTITDNEFLPPSSPSADVPLVLWNCRFVDFSDNEVHKANALPALVEVTDDATGDTLTVEDNHVVQVR